MERFTIVLARTPSQREVKRVGATTDLTTLEDVRKLFEAEQLINRVTGIRIHISSEEVADDGRV